MESESVKQTKDDFPQFQEEDEESESKQTIFQMFIKTLKKVKKDKWTLLLLLLFNGLYLLFGGLVFYLLERHTLNSSRKIEQVKMLFNFFQTLNTSTEIRQSSTFDTLSLTDIQKIDKIIEKISNEREEWERSDWTIPKSVFFASTVVTTIGYGNLAPSTAWGRSFCVLYAIIGIPLTLVLLAMVGKTLSSNINTLCRIIVNNVQKYLYSGYKYDSMEGVTELNAPVWLAITFIMIFLSLDALVFMCLEDWSYFKSLYFLFITLTTIGFGDIVPQGTKAIWFHVTLLYVGLAAVSITINLIIAKVRIQYHKQKQKIKFVETLERKLTKTFPNESTPLTKAIDCDN
ncbi:TWiK family of potassium channels protein 7 isoform X2 [Hydra vulgaris]|uniref:TWiK family of potassium channels protein 7 isoform X2 n=1 Tax=Hydra vulgaris TaxID=6087 RepID=A0ABM4DG77_HYDVU